MKKLEKIIATLAGIVITSTTTTYQGCNSPILTYTKQRQEVIQKIPDIPFHLRPEYQQPEQPNTYQPEKFPKKYTI